MLCIWVNPTLALSIRTETCKIVVLLCTVGTVTGFSTILKKMNIKVSLQISIRLFLGGVLELYIRLYTVYSVF